MDWQFWVFWVLGLMIASIFGAWVVKKHRSMGLPVLGAFLACWVLSANILVPRLVSIDLFWPMVLTTGSIIWPFVTQLSDQINEVYGRNKTYAIAAIAYLINVIFITFIYMGMHATALWDGAHEAVWVEYFAVAPRIFGASLVCYAVESFLDITVFSIIKNKLWGTEATGSFWKVIGGSTLRSLSSDVLNMIIDAVLFMFLAFYGVIPNDQLVVLIFSGMAAKVILTTIDTPFFWLFKWLTRGVEREK